MTRRTVRGKRPHLRTTAVNQGSRVGATGPVVVDFPAIFDGGAVCALGLVFAIGQG